MLDLGVYGRYAVIIVAATAGAALIALAAARLSRWIRAAGAVLAAIGVALSAITEFDSNLGIALLVVFASGMVGSVFAKTIGDLNTLTAFALAAAVADFVSFVAGPTRFLLDRGPAIGGYARYLAVGVNESEGLVLVVGFGDLVFVAVFTLALLRLGASLPAAWAAPTSGLLIALGVGLITEGTVGIPLAAATTIVYSHLRLRAREPLAASGERA